MAKCAVSDCEAEKSKRQWCGKHYLRWYHHGDPEYVRPTFDICQIDGCAKPTRSKVLGLCEMHYYRIRRHGDPLVVVDTKHPVVTYRAAHSRVTQARGRASSHPCVDCGQPAHHWSYRHDDPAELTAPKGQTYSMKPEHYDPRCAPCHAVFDGTGANQYTYARQE